LELLTPPAVEIRRLELPFPVELNEGRVRRTRMPAAHRATIRRADRASPLRDDAGR